MIAGMQGAVREIVKRNAVHAVNALAALLADKSADVPT
jgi:hypothetical protein